MAVLYDLGAEGGIPKRWDTKHFKLLFPELELVAFDLDETKLSGDQKRKNLTLIDKIISDTEEVTDFYVPVRHSGSSIFPFNEDYSYLHSEKYHVLDKIVQVETATLGNLIDKKKIPPADIIKMDIQGAELGALKGMGEYLNNVNVLELEVEFIQVYKDQPTFVELHSFLTEAGFHLQDLHLSKTFMSDGKTPNFFLKTFTGVAQNTNWTPQVYAGDAVYVKNLSDVLGMDFDDQIHHLKCLCSYNCFDRAFLIISKSKFRSDIEKSEFYTNLIDMAQKGKIRTRMAKVLSKILRTFRIPVSPMFNRTHPWIKRTFPNL